MLNNELDDYLFCQSRKRCRRSLCSSTLYLLLYWASRGWGQAVLLGSLDTAKLAERAWVRSSMRALKINTPVLILYYKEEWLLGLRSKTTGNPVVYLFLCARALVQVSLKD